MCLPTPATGGQHKWQNTPHPHGPHGGPQGPGHSPRIWAKCRKNQKCIWVATSTCMWLHDSMWLQQIVLGAFIGRLDFFCIFLINSINLSSAAMATEFAISRPMAQRPELAFGCCFGVGSPAQAAHFRAHPTLGAWAHWQGGMHAGRPKGEISVKCCPAQKNA